MSLYALGLLECQGDLNEKSLVLFNLLNKKESADGKKYLTRETLDQSIIIDHIIEISEILLHFNNNANNDRGALQDLASIDYYNNKQNIINEMKQTIDDNFAIAGFINLLFISNTKLYYHNFIKKMNAKNLNWIFNPEKVV